MIRSTTFFAIFRGLSAAIVLLALGFPVNAGERSAPDPKLEADWVRRLELAKALKHQAKSMEQEAKKRYEAEKLACFERFRVTDCQEEARSRYLASANEARRIESEGQAEERQVNKEKQAEKDARHLAEAPERAADRERRKADKAERQQRAEEKRAQKKADKERRAKEGAERRARDAERQEKKKAKHERKVAEQMEEAKRREAEAAQRKEK